MNQLQQQKQAVVTFWQHFVNQPDFTVLKSVVRQDMLFRGTLGIVKHGLDGLQSYLETASVVFDNYHVEIQDLIAEDTTVVAQLHFSGIHKGELMGIKGTGRPIHYHGTATANFDGPLIKKMWVLGAMHEVLQQIS